MAMASGYTIDLYCDGPGPHPHGAFPVTFFDESGAKARRAARDSGWRLNMRTGRALCPKCAKEGK